MKSKITQADIARAIGRLNTRDAKITLNSIRAELGHQGSKTTILKLLRSLNSIGINEDSSDVELVPAISSARRALINDLVSDAKTNTTIDSLIEVSLQEGCSRTVVTELCLTIKQLKLELMLCHSNIETLRSSQKQALDTLRASIKQ
ncbi:DNA-binding protein [Pseudomonas sp. YuFO8]|uniref:DNA-binding protein n=1 Tax=Pseudomonas sp. YuFO8 TaxID=3095361 RepID=UPI002B251826|nr:DNA-binding protein [Pseudomonas sp. YuFO8]MEB2623780.1 DNA-binding protein [Pseudomonas sp. YuFO8]